MNRTPLSPRHAIWAVAATALLLLSACGRSSVSNEGPPTPLQTRAAATARYAQFLQSDAPAIQVAIVDQGTNTVLLRETRRDGVDVFISPDGVALRLTNGLLSGTAGLGGDMQGSDVSQSAAMLRSGGGVAERFHTFLGGDYRAVTRAFKCIVTPRGGETIDVGTRSGGLRQLRTRLVHEDCKSLDHEFRNLYWIGVNGRILQSRQWAGEVTGPLVIRVVLD